MFKKLDLFPSSGERVRRHLLSWICYKQIISITGVGASPAFHLKTETVAVSETMFSFRIFSNDTYIYIYISLSIFLFTHYEHLPTGS
jgi:hypothetical protein